MSTLTRISLAALRRTVYRRPDLSASVPVRADELLALVDAVEAARALTLTGYVPPPRLYAEVDALHEALERFA